MMSHPQCLEETPLLQEAEVVRLAAEGGLPSCFQVTVSSRALRPTLDMGSVVTVENRGPFKGAVICLVWNDRLVWRRVLATRGDQILLRAEMAPFADGWFSDIVGCVRASNVLSRWGERFPSIWTTCGWWGNWLHARARNLPHRFRVSRGEPGRFQCGRLESRHLDAFRALCFLVHRENSEEKLKALDGRSVGLGLWTMDGALVGSTFLRPHLDEAYSFETMVDPAFRGRGYATALVGTAIEEARRLKLRRVYAYISRDNFASLRAYEHSGFRLTGKWWRDSGDPFLASEWQLQEVEVRFS